jgi:hypothetical protein
VYLGRKNNGAQVFLMLENYLKLQNSKENAKRALKEN